jgi:hypothetical protein
MLEAQLAVEVTILREPLLPLLSSGTTLAWRAGVSSPR